MTKNKLIEHPMSNEFVIDGLRFYNFNFLRMPDGNASLCTKNAIVL